MKEIIVFIQFIVIAISQSQSNDQIDCNKYLSKFGTKESPLAFSGDAIYFQEFNEVQINVKYTDILFDDPLYFGLVQEDGKQPETTCLKLKVLSFTDTHHQSSKQLSDLKITTSNNTINKWRQYQFKIPASELQSNIIDNNIIYNGFYSFIMETKNQEAIKHEFNFDFTLTVNLPSQIQIDTSFKFQLKDQLTNINPPQSKLLWCSNITCQSVLNESPFIRLNDTFVIKQVIIDSGITNQYLNNTQVWYIGYGLNKKATPIQIINTTPGQVILELKAEIVWQKISINVTSSLSGSPSINNVENIIETSFKPLDSSPEYPYQNDSVIRWCSDISCQTFLDEIPNLHLNDQFIIQQAVINKDYDDFFISDTEVWLIGTGLNKKAQPIRVINNVQKQVIIELKAEVIWTNLTIKVTSYIKDSSQQISGEINQIQCIKPEGQETCGTYECEECYNYQFTAFLNMILLFLLNI
ncbi:unnamed protein product [Paramecium pentaurelia]|uniref:Transmembrane protein n=1 Tax=Paramecium pentaurelia TaxID=43138 RepID=A0A8S1XT35_9CILI|nr:unnamed protein product [Paramecium pentaurelia]